MSKGIYVALSGAVTQEISLDTTATNVANAASPGFQRLRPVFREALASARAADGNLRYGKVDHTSVDTSRGAVRVTGRSLDVALPAGSYLAVDSPRGEKYTRAGQLTMDSKGVLRAAAAPVVDEKGGPIRVQRDGGEVSIDPDGVVRQAGAAIGKLKTVSFERPDALLPEGGLLLGRGNAGDAKPEPPRLEVGSLEESNAEPVVAMTELLTATRTFEAFQKAIDTFGEVDRKLLTTVPSGFE